MIGPGRLIRSALHIPIRLIRLLEGFWTVPLLMGVLALGLALGLVPLGVRFGIGGDDSFVGGWIDADGGRAALSAIAGGVMSVVGIVFSLTFVALSITAQQLSPRIVDYVVQERVTQMLVGTAIATFLFSTISLSLGSDEEVWQLDVAVPVALALAVLTLGTVVLFAHRMTRVMRTEEMVALLGGTFVEAIKTRAAVQGREDALELSDEAIERLENAPYQFRCTSLRAGYVASIDRAGLIALAKEHDQVIRLTVRPNDFLLPGDLLADMLRETEATAEDEEAMAEALRRTIDLTDRRVPTESADYEAASLSEAALRALSPGINDPATAISCINRLFEGLVVMAQEGSAPQAFADDSAALRLVVPPQGVLQFLEGSVLPVAVAGQEDYRIRRRIDLHCERLESLCQTEVLRDGVVAFRRRVSEREGAPFQG